jgi:hypothetical protein
MEFRPYCLEFAMRGPLLTDPDDSFSVEIACPGMNVASNKIIGLPLNDMYVTSIDCLSDSDVHSIYDTSLNDFFYASYDNNDGITFNYQRDNLSFSLTFDNLFSLPKSPAGRQKYWLILRRWLTPDQIRQNILNLSLFALASITQPATQPATDPFFPIYMPIPGSPMLALRARAAIRPPLERRHKHAA